MTAGPRPRGAPFATLRSFTRSGRAEPPTTEAAAVLRRITERPRERAGECCEMCGEPIADEHSHVANLTDRRLMCTCRACYLLFTREGAAAGRYLAVPERYAYDPAFVLTDAQWDRLQIPVDLVFFFRQTDLDRFVACYPSPQGATESTLDLDSWQEVLDANPLLDTLQPDVEAALVRRNGNGAFECFRTPIDACYELVGIVRQYWTGFHGGEEVWTRIEQFFDKLRDRSARTSGGG